MIEKRRRIVLIGLVAFAIAAMSLLSQLPQQEHNSQGSVAGTSQATSSAATGSAADALATLQVKGRAPRTGYAREQFGAGWASVGSCDMREYILARDLTRISFGSDECTVLSGALDDPYTGKRIEFKRGKSTSSKVQIDHVVALSNAWQTGAQLLDEATRAQLANDPLELLAVDGPSNQQKSDADAATWLPPNKDYRCRYVARQIAVKQKYALWVTNAERDAMQTVLSRCDNQQLPVVEQGR